MRAWPLRVPLKPKSRLEWGTQLLSHNQIQNIQTQTSPLSDAKQKSGAPFKPVSWLEWDTQRLDRAFFSNLFGPDFLNMRRITSDSFA
jgi:hypothetical protein